MENKKFWCVTIIINTRKIDKLYRTDEKIARSLAQMYHDLYPEAKIDVKEEYLSC